MSSNDAESHGIGFSGLAKGSEVGGVPTAAGEAGVVLPPGSATFFFAGSAPSEPAVESGVTADSIPVAFLLTGATDSVVLRLGSFPKSFGG